MLKYSEVKKRMKNCHRMLYMAYMALTNDSDTFLIVLYKAVNNEVRSIIVEWKAALK